MLNITNINRYKNLISLENMFKGGENINKEKLIKSVLKNKLLKGPLNNENSEKIITHLIFIIILFTLFSCLFSTIHASTIINIKEGATSSEIQSIIDNADIGSTLNFVGKTYTNISLTINKALNIVTKIETTIYGSSKNTIGEAFSSVFYFTENSSGSVISGFNIKTDGNYGILANNANNITIIKNNISNANKSAILINNSKNVKIESNNLKNSSEGIYSKNSSNIKIESNNVSNNKNNGVYIESSKEVTIKSNNIKDNENDGIYIEKSQSINLEKNIVEKNNRSGVTVVDTRKTVIKKNKIIKNSYHGITLRRTVNSQISDNEISENKINGIALIEETENSTILNNNISLSSNGIFINSNSINDKIIYNNILNNRYTGYSTDEELFFTDKYGNGILFGPSYNFNGNTPLIENNSIIGNSMFSVKADNADVNIEIGANWYGTTNERLSKLCPRIKSRLLSSPARYYDSSATGINTQGNGKNTNSGDKTSNGWYYRENTESGDGTGDGPNTGPGDGVSNGENRAKTATGESNLKQGTIRGSDGPSGGNNGVKEIKLEDSLFQLKENSQYIFLIVIILIAAVLVGFFVNKRKRR